MLRRLPLLACPCHAVSTCLARRQGAELHGLWDPAEGGAVAAADEIIRGALGGDGAATAGGDAPAAEAPVQAGAQQGGAAAAEETAEERARRIASQWIKDDSTAPPTPEASEVNSERVGLSPVAHARHRLSRLDVGWCTSPGPSVCHEAPQVSAHAVPAV